MDRRIIKTKDAIRKAYLNLIMEKGPSHISVSEVARRANIDRKTFYLHYDSIEDVLEEHIKDRFHKIVMAMEENDYFRNPFNAGTLIGIVDKFYKEEEDLLLAMAGSDSYNELWRHAHDILSDKIVKLYSPMVNIDAEEIRIIFDMVGAGVIDAYRRWARGEYSVNLHRLVEIMNETAENGLRPYLK